MGWLWAISSVPSSVLCYLLIRHSTSVWNSPLICLVPNYYTVLSNLIVKPHWQLYKLFKINKLCHYSVYQVTFYIVAIRRQGCLKLVLPIFWSLLIYELKSKVIWTDNWEGKQNNQRYAKTKQTELMKYFHTQLTLFQCSNITSATQPASQPPTNPKIIFLRPLINLFRSCCLPGYLPGCLLSMHYGIILVSIQNCGTINSTKNV